MPPGEGSLFPLPLDAELYTHLTQGDLKTSQETRYSLVISRLFWIPAFAGMTSRVFPVIPAKAGIQRIKKIFIEI